MQATPVTWALVVFGAVTLLPLFWAQLAMLIRPNEQDTTDLIIGKGEGWRDRTHFSFALGAAWADWVFFAPLFVAGSIGALLGYAWAGIQL